MQQVEECVRAKLAWTQLPNSVKQVYSLLYGWKSTPYLFIFTLLNVSQRLQLMVLFTALIITVLFSSTISFYYLHYLLFKLSVFISHEYLYYSDFMVTVSCVLQLLGNSQKEYYRFIYEFSIRNQLRFRGNLGNIQNLRNLIVLENLNSFDIFPVRSIRKDEKHYYEALIESSIQRLMLFPYHLADMIVKGIRYYD